MVQKLIAGLHHFKKDMFRQQRELFERLASGQRPETLFITCSDSRIDPNLITHTDPGELFVLRNAGNLVPPFGATNGGELATIEFAVTGLEVRDIVVCGHSHCGAIKGLLKPELLAEMPAVADWLKLAESTRRIVKTKYRHLEGEELLEVAIDEHVLVQIENLQTHPAVAAALAADRLKIHAWVYDIPSGEVFAYDDSQEQFTPLGDIRPPVPPSIAGFAASSSTPNSNTPPGPISPLAARLHDAQSGDARVWK